VVKRRKVASTCNAYLVSTVFRLPSSAVFINLIGMIVLYDLYMMTVIKRQRLKIAGVTPALETPRTRRLQGCRGALAKMSLFVCVRIILCTA